LTRNNSKTCEKPRKPKCLTYLEYKTLNPKGKKTQLLLQQIQKVNSQLEEEEDRNNDKIPGEFLKQFQSFISKFLSFYF